MSDTNIGSAAVVDISNSIVSYSVDSETTDSTDGSVEFTYQNPHWTEDFGYYMNIPEFKTAIDTKALWTIGAGFESDDRTVLLLDMIKGNGNDSFNSILKNMLKVKTLTGDSFAEIIRDKNDVLVNLKPLDPSSMVIVSNGKGRIIRYEQVVKNKTPNKKFNPDEIFHLCNDRIADNVHGTRIVKSLKFLILARNEAMTDWKTVLHRNVFPMWIIHADTDDEGEIAILNTKMQSAYKNKDFMIVPKGAVVPELVATATNASLNPLAWINQLNDYFFQAVMVPQIIVGQGKEFTDASGKIVYLAYEQSVKAEQLYLEEQVLSQLNLEIMLTFPASLQNEVLNQQEKSPISGAVEPNDQTVELEGKK